MDEQDKQIGLVRVDLQKLVVPLVRQLAAQKHVQLTAAEVRWLNSNRDHPARQSVCALLQIARMGLDKACLGLLEGAVADMRLAMREANGS